MTLIHPFTSNALDSNFLGIIYTELSRNSDSIIVIVSQESKALIERRFENFIQRIIFIDNEILLPKFKFKEIAIQALKLKSILNSITKQYSITKLITENDCMSFSQIVLCTYFSNKNINIEIYQGLKELHEQQYLKDRIKEYQYRYGKLKGRFLLFIKKNTAQIVFLITFKFIFPVNRLPLRNYITRICISGIYLKIKCFCYELDYKIKRERLIPNSYTEIIPHSLINEEIPVEILLGKAGNINQLNYLFLIPIEITVNGLKRVLEKIENLGVNNCSLKFHPSMSKEKFHQFSNLIRNKSINILPQNSYLSDYLINCTNVIDFSEEESSVKNMILLLNKRNYNINYCLKKNL